MKEDKNKLQLLSSIMAYVDEFGWNAFDDMIETVKIIQKAKDDERGK